jgi:hypothetical protein
LISPSLNVVANENSIAEWTEIRRGQSQSPWRMQRAISLEEFGQSPIGVDLEDVLLDWTDVALKSDDAATCARGGDCDVKPEHAQVVKGQAAGKSAHRGSATGIRSDGNWQTGHTPFDSIPNSQTPTDGKYCFS